MRRRLLGRIFLLVFLLAAFQSGRIFYAEPLRGDVPSVRDLALWIALVSACLVLAGGALLIWWNRRQPRGAQLVQFAALKAHCHQSHRAQSHREKRTGDTKRTGDATHEPLFFGGIDGYSPQAATSHFFLAGGTGSGKTLNLSMMMGSVLPPIWQNDVCLRHGQPQGNSDTVNDRTSNDRTSNDRRAVIFDVKQDMISTLLATGSADFAL